MKPRFSILALFALTAFVAAHVAGAMQPNSVWKPVSVCTGLLALAFVIQHYERLPSRYRRLADLFLFAETAFVVGILGITPVELAIVGVGICGFMLQRAWRNRGSAMGEPADTSAA
jgi:hypothetical protein